MSGHVREQIRPRPGSTSDMSEKEHPMRRPFAMARFGQAWLRAAALAAVLSAVVLGAAAVIQGEPPWLPLNATSHVLFGPEAAEFRGIDLTHTGLGLVIHLAAALFWAAVALLFARMGDRPSIILAWSAALTTAAIAGIVDFGLMPARLTPGWELVLPPAGLFAALLAMGVGMALGMIHAERVSRARLPHFTPPHHQAKHPGRGSSL